MEEQVVNVTTLVNFDERSFGEIFFDQKSVDERFFDKQSIRRKIIRPTAPDPQTRFFLL